MPLKWSELLESGLPEVDAGNRLLLLLRINDYIQALLKRQGEKELGTLLEFLGKYTDTNLQFEEKLLLGISYPDIENHKKQHENLKANLNRLCDSYRANGVSEELIYRVNTEIVNWIIDHLHNADADWREFIKNKKAADTPAAFLPETGLGNH